MMLITSIVYAEPVSFMWTPNTESNLAGYKIYYNHDKDDHDNDTVIDCGLPEIKTNSNGTERIVYTSDIEPGDYYFYSTAYDTDGFESDYTEGIYYTVVNLPPKTPFFKICILRNNDDGSVDVLSVNGDVLFHINQ